MHAFYHRLLGFFPIQLVLVHLKSNQLLMVFWLLLFAFITKYWGRNYGVPLLFLDPEYLGEVNFFSYLLLGLSFGAFQMAFQISSYLVNCRNFPFLASLNRPFVKYTINNSIIPIAFLLTYAWMNISFQFSNEVFTLTDILLNLSGFFVGAGFFFVVSLTYFYTASRDFLLFFGLDISKKNAVAPRKLTKFLRVSVFSDQRQHKVKSYLAHPFKLSLARDVSHYEQGQIDKVFRRNHLAAGVYEFAVLMIILLLSLFRDNPVFMIPAGASIFLALTMLLLLSSAVITWLRDWSFSATLFILVGLNYLSGYEFFGKRNQAFGLDYQSEPAMIPDSMLFDNARKIQVDRDSREGLKQLRNWKLQAPFGKNGKPTLVLINVSGGGLKSAYWTFAALQKADSVCQGRLLRSSNLITGSSGGMIGAAYLRELHLRSRTGRLKDLYDRSYAENVGKDLLNPIGFSLAVSDVFFRFQSVAFGNRKYTRDRGFEFENALHQNTGFILDKSLKDYRASEKTALVPMMVFSPSIINDGRRMLISAQPISYLTFNSVRTGTVFRNLPEDIEFSRMFAKHGADDLRFSTAIRMNATFPYILPTVALPSNPILELMDAGFRDNYGTRTAIRYLYEFRNWIATNTDRVIILQVRENHKAIDLKTRDKSTLFELISSPLGSVYENMFRIQDYQHEQLLMYAQTWYKGKIELVEFDLNSAFGIQEEISMNFHLTSKEKQKIMLALERPENRQAFKKLHQLLMK